MIGRLVWWSVLGLLASVTVLAQLDRSARFTPALAPFVPESFVGFAAERNAQRAVLAQDGAPALAATRALVAVRPLPAEHLTLLAQAQLLAGEEGKAIATLEAATKRGWRAPLAQLAAAQAAIAEDEYDAAALRLNALFATNGVPDQAVATLAALLTSEGGRAAFAERLASEGRWQGNLIARIDAAIPPADLAPTLALAQQRGAQLPCAALARIAQRYEREGFVAEAALFDPATCV